MDGSPSGVPWRFGAHRSDLRVWLAGVSDPPPSAEVPVSTPRCDISVTPVAGLCGMYPNGCALRSVEQALSGVPWDGTEPDRLVRPWLRPGMGGLVRGSSPVRGSGPSRRESLMALYSITGGSGLRVEVDESLCVVLVQELLDPSDVRRVTVSDVERLREALAEAKAFAAFEFSEREVPKPETVALSAAQAAALAVIDAHGSSYVGTQTAGAFNEVHHAAARVLVQVGICEYHVGGDGQFVRRVEVQTQPPAAAALIAAVAEQDRLGLRLNERELDEKHDLMGPAAYSERERREWAEDGIY
jgi:hypothetical protein